MNCSIFQKLFPVFVCVLLAASSLFYATRLYDLSPSALVTKDILFQANEFTSDFQINAINGVFSVENSLLKLSAARGIYANESSVFDIKTPLNIPLEPNLTLTYSVYVSKLNLTTDAGWLSLNMFNGTNVTVLSYNVGREPPEYAFQGYTYISYRIGNATERWLRGTRNIWEDVKNKAVSFTNSWRITALVFGLISYSDGGFTNNHSMQASCDLSTTYLRYENSVLATVNPAIITFAWKSFYGLVGSVVFFCAFSAVYLKLLKRVKQCT